MFTASFTLNGRPVEVATQPMRPLVEVLREELGLTGTKKSCEEGECGACTVLLDGEPVPSCLLPVARVNGRSVTTIEGLAMDGRLHPLQESFVASGAVQCGFCTPGMILSAKSLLDKNPAPSREDIKEALSGNICRCTGYAKIIAAVELAADMLRQAGGQTDAR
ncbi:MAG: (2Fe-2S)-binding protein [Dehalococcoidales bacterium]|nr:(2Fe-2S)-binding protein [Dehalococcoidales bacterium]